MFTRAGYNPEISDVMHRANCQSRQLNSESQKRSNISWPTHNRMTRIRESDS